MGLFTQNGLLRTTFFTNDGLLRLLYDPTLVVDLDLRTNTLPAGLTFSRASAATDVINGVLTSFASGVPRISVANGYFGENEQRTNLCFPSTGEIFTYSGTGTITSTPNFGIAPDGTTTTNKWNSTTTLAYGFKQVTMSAGGTYTISCFVRKTSEAKFFTVKNWFLGGTSIGATYNLNTQDGSITGTGGTSSVQDCGAFWRVAVTLADTGSNTTCRITLQPANSNFDFEIWGYQIEAGEGATSYIPTTTAASTRAADILLVNPAINATEGMLIAEYVENIDFAANKWTRAASLNDGTTNNVIEVYNAPGTTGHNLYEKTGNVRYSDDAIGNSGVGGLTKWGVAYSASGISGCINGGDVLTKAVAAPAGLNRVTIGAYNFCGYVRRIQYYNARNDVKMRALTA